MTVSSLAQQLTVEEMLGWAAFYEIKAEEEEKAMDRARTGRGARQMSTR
tara:strand:+ start:212 stop:358 length:147 start_codon:yes stop_codon:yes gene_type:complete